MSSATSNHTPSGSTKLPAQIQRLVDWNTEILYRLLQQVVEKRKASGKSTWTSNNEPQLPPSNSILEEVADVIDLPGFTQAPRGSNLNHHSKQNRRSSISALVEDDVYDDPNQEHLAAAAASAYDEATGLEAARQQLKEFVTAVANAYHQNPFHCLQHSTAVTTHLTKLLSRIVVDDPIDEDDVPTPPHNSGSGGGGALSLEQAAAAAVNHLKSIGSSDEDDDDGIVDDEDGQDPLDPQDVLDDIAPYLHNHSYGITSDPLTQFALIFSALIGYVDHTGVPNASIAKEEPDLAARYQGRSIVEQRSVEKAWKKLMEPSFVELRRCIYADATELERFRQVVVNSVLSIDVADDELQQMRRARWEETFQQEMTTTPTIRDVNRKATIVLEHLMQASDVFHTMQPWIVYEKWSGKDFQEKYNAFCHGRSDDDPRGTWYSNEMEMFDNYIIPLAMQLKDCDAFVVSSDEYLIYALKNRQKLAAKKDLVDTFLAKIEAATGGTNTTASANGTEGQGHPINFFARQDLFSGPSKSMEESEESKASRQMQRLIDWNVEMLKRLLKQLVARRRAAVAAGMVLPEANDKEIITKETRVSNSPSILDEMYQTPMDFPDFDPALSLETLDPDTIDIGAAAEKQLRQYVTDVSSRFKKNDFHGLEHESQVCMSARKLLSRISSLVIPPGATVPPAHLGENGMGLVEPNASELHDRTFGFSSDPLAQFALVFASLILDCDHQGVSNAQLARENHPLAIQYNNKGISQQHSLEMTWAHLMMPEFADLRRCIYGYDGVELKRFRQLVVRCMLATDLETEELALFRRKQWDLLFGAPTLQMSSDAGTRKEKYNQRAMLVLEVLMQTSYLFHANQNWQLYHKWNDRLFTEIYKAYRLGRIPQDPSVMWYKSELLFFDEHVIPIAKRINDCGIFVTFGGNGNTQTPSGGGTEYLSFALSNRQQWAAKGGDLIASMMARYHGKEIERNRTRRSYRRTSLTATAKSA